MSGAVAMARGLGWFSLALGAAEVLAPRAIARGVGLRGGEGLVAAYGAREIATGAGLLLARDPAPWVWGRVAGDALDLATLAAARPRGGREMDNRGLALAAVLGAAALDLVCARALAASGGVEGRAAEAARRREIAAAYGTRTGFPRGLATARGAARDFKVPEGFRTPEALRPFTADAVSVPVGA